MLRTAQSRRVATVFAALVLVFHSAHQVAAQDEHLGEIEYEVACMACHGVDGKGNGPQAKDLTPPPSDLTSIAKSNGGKFPFKDVVAMIDGRKQVTAHGQRAMPVWGDRYSVKVEPGESNSEVERRAQERVRALARYIEALQVK